MVHNVDAGYGAVRVLHGVTIEVREGETVALLGTNGKSTLIKCLMGMVTPEAGEIVLETDAGRVDLVGKSTEEIIRFEERGQFHAASSLYTARGRRSTVSVSLQSGVVLDVADVALLVAFLQGSRLHGIGTKRTELFA